MDKISQFIVQNVLGIVFNHPILFVLFVLIFLWVYVFSYYREGEKKLRRMSMASNLSAWALFIIFFIFFGLVAYIHPKDTSESIGLILQWIMYISSIVFVILAFFGTAFITDKIKNLFVRNMIRLFFTIVHSLIALALFFPLLFFIGCGIGHCDF